MSFTKFIPQYNLDATLTSGQMFRAYKQNDGSYLTLSSDKYCFARMDRDGDTLTVECDDLDNAYWKRYFNIDTDFEAIEQMTRENSFLYEVYKYSEGITILKQDPWECLISFIISQHNNISRINECMERLCSLNARPLYGYYCAFPTAREMAQLPLHGLGLGYREQYIRDATGRANAGALNLEAYTADKVDYQTARTFLLGIYGVGPKVADCTALYGLGHTQAFPVDVHIQRVLDLPEMRGFDYHKYGEYAGLLQLYIFNYAMNNGL